MDAIKAVQGGRWPPQPLVWLVGDSPANLTGAAGITGSIRNRATGQVRAVAGALALANAAAGEFVWTYAAEDVAEAGEFDVQFVAAFASGPTPGKTFLARFSVAAALSG